MPSNAEGSYVIHQITDTHIPVSGDMTVRDNFLRLMAYCEEAQPDLLVITGDLPGEDGSREAYEWMRTVLPADIPFLVIPGNHDDPDSLFEVLGHGLNTSGDFIEHIPLADIDLLFVNTWSTRLPADQLARVEAADIRPGSVLFLHHPTKEISGGFMDINYALGNREEVDAALRRSNFEHVFCGHYHTDFHVNDGYHLYITPSPAFDVDLYQAEPVITPASITLREIVIRADRVDTRVIYLEEGGGPHARQH
jgi:3',5'-cyclic AMP phosphodiesterase CpdA